ncbi:MAG TPA: cytochrome c oxidase subunit II [Pyrinomonadaceae bacterium]|nr:cytochrome c oxidase subunit II [Pyrinomonadaceae bacterium]
MTGRALAVVIWLLTIFCVGLFFMGWWFPPSISEHGPAYDQQFLITIIVVGISFVLAQVGLGYMVWRYRDTGHGERALYSHGSNKLEMTWTVITAIIFISLAVLGQRVWASLHFQAAPPGSAQIEVVAQQFQWNFHYPGADKKFGRTDPKLVSDADLNFVGLDQTDGSARDDAVVASIAVPLNRPVELTLRAKDVTHSFWVPQLRFKQDLVPGMNIKVHFTANKAGKYELACAELCGQFHFKMKSYMLVIPANEYDELVALPQAQFQARMGELLKRYQ